VIIVGGDQLGAGPVVDFVGMFGMPFTPVAMTMWRGRSIDAPTATVEPSRRYILAAEDRRAGKEYRHSAHRRAVFQHYFRIQPAGQIKFAPAPACRRDREGSR
jgi:hypothetical protein